MPTVADYVIIRAPKFKISSQPGGTPARHFEFSLPRKVDSGSRAILAFVLSVLKGCKFEASINNKAQLQYEFQGPTTVALHDAVGANVLVEGSNMIEFRITRASGTLEFSEIILHYRRALN